MLLYYFIFSNTRTRNISRFKNWENVLFKQIFIGSKLCGLFCVSVQVIKNPATD